MNITTGALAWACRYCTFQNTTSTAQCQACGGENRRMKPKTGVFSKLQQLSLSNAAHFIDQAVDAFKPRPEPVHTVVQLTSEWLCPTCQRPNPSDYHFCANCGGDKIIDPRLSGTHWQCHRCQLQQPSAPFDSICPLCRKKSPQAMYMPTLISAPGIPLTPISTETALPVSDDAKTIDAAYNRVMEYCRAHNQPFIDDSFPHSARSIGDFSRLERKDVQIVWLRPAEIYTKDGRVSPWKVFANPKPTDIEQGLLGNCWLLSALAVIAERTEILERIVLTKTYNHHGVYKIRLCVDGLWQTVLVDDFFPCHKRSKSMVFAVGRNNQLWVSLIEKALAKIYGNYAALKAGRTYEGLATLTGAPCEHIDLEVDLNNSTEATAQALDLIWGRLLSAKEANFLMGGSCGAGRRQVSDEEYTRVGLMTRHAYSILDVRQHGQHKLLRLRNPWGTFTWKGEWSLGWPGWTDSLKMALGYEATRRQTGTFWIPFERFVQFFDSVELAHVKDGFGWTSQRFPLDLSWTAPKVVTFTVTESTEICFTLFQRLARTSLDQADIVLLVHRIDPATGLPGELVIRSGRRCLPSVRTEDHFFETGQYVVVAMSLAGFVDAKVLPATIVIHSGKRLVCQMEPTSPEALRTSLVQMSLKEGTAIEYLPNVKLYQISNNFSGLLLMIDNLHHHQCVQVKADCHKSENVLSSRGDLVVADNIPPLHRQIVLVLTHCEPSQPFVVQHQLNQRLTKTAKLGDFALFSPDSQNWPLINAPQASTLHGPRALYL
uniref:Calpain catalytic domain-containing protein n=1 Tax=Panagrellus redivivus TaxID=6233 RepID=A0A7E4UTJ3_PANRE